MNWSSQNKKLENHLSVFKCLTYNFLLQHIDECYSSKHYECVNVRNTPLLVAFSVVMT